ncbi:MAG: excinuclease ABC subunit UvrC [Deltaproteobacteria bacterium]|nr:excinuclease ABC subunit UvrC [Deltaproteobacteria bacterium]MBW2662933.1 excinuclease ABC subunit UvrC [Deltaproteobacteria bacterium]
MKVALHKKLSIVSSEPGVYLMKDAHGKIIYVGKAGNLKKRISSYFSKQSQSDIKTRALVGKISTFETIITGTEKEALILESNLIKRHKPKYNIILKDDKRYPCLRLDINSAYPNLTIVRDIKKNGSSYFGPFTSSNAVRETLKIINKTFKLRKCRTKEFKKRSRPCLNFQIKACLAPCCLDVDKSVYSEIVKEVAMFLNGRASDLIRKIKNEMILAAKAHAFEQAAILRDKLFAIKKTLEKQVVVATDFKDRDVIAVAGSSEYYLIAILFVRRGCLLGVRYYSFSETISDNAEMVRAFITQYYEKTPFIPEEILVPIHLNDAPLLEDWLYILKGEKVNILHPQRGEKARLLNMAIKNAENRLKDQIASNISDMELLDRLRKRLKMERAPLRIECFDNSNISGTEPVAGMVVFEKGKPKRSSYRKYSIKTVPKQDDYAYMAEVLKRRYNKGDKSKPYPDLLMVDGGKGQINIAMSVIKGLKLDSCFEIIGIAKKDEKRGEKEDKIYKPGRVNPINFGREGDLLLFLQRIRDEAHRFAISFHRKRRGKASLHSALDAIPSVGKKRKAILLKHFKSIKKIRTATLEELSALPGISHVVAKAVKSALAGHFHH